MEPEKSIAPLNWRSHCIPVKSSQMTMRTNHNYFGGAMQKAREAKYLCDAARSNNQQLLQDFIDLQYDINSQMTHTEYTALHEAIEQGHIEAATMLLQNKANPNLKECRGFTPFHIAVKNKHTRLIHLLVDNGAYALKDKFNYYPERYMSSYYSGETPTEGIDIKNEEFYRKSHSALLYARLATLEKERAHVV